VNVKTFASVEKVQQWIEIKNSTDLRWVELLTHFDVNEISCTNVLLLVEYCLGLPRTNAATERVFSLMNNIWTSDKTQLNVDTSEAMFITKVNFSLSCSDFYDMLLQQPRLLKAIHSSEKYN
jgi:hypothetical protein